MKKLNLLFPEVLLARLKLLQGQTGLTASDLIRRAVEDYLKKEGV